MNNEVLKAMCERRSVRSYKSDPVPQELIKQVVRVGTHAATGMNRQSPIILAVTNKERGAISFQDERRHHVFRQRSVLRCAGCAGRSGDKSADLCIRHWQSGSGQHDALAAHTFGDWELLDSSGETGIRQHGRKAILGAAGHYGRL